MFAAIFVLVILPWLDTSKVRSAIFRPLYKQFYWFLVADVLILGYVGAMPAEGLYLLVALKIQVHLVETSFYNLDISLSDTLHILPYKLDILFAVELYQIYQKNL